jgi:hypothetical protein
MDNEFENVNAENSPAANADDSPAANSPAANADDGPADADNSNSSESNSNSNSSESNSSESNSSNSNSSNSNTSVEPIELASSPVTASKGRSAAALKLEKDRREVFEGDLKQAYSDAFGDEKKAPKPKFLEATALVKIRKEKGENAYRNKIKEYVNRNRGSFEGKTKKVRFSNSTHKVAHTEPNGDTMKSVTEMAKAAKDSIDAMVNAIRGHTSKHRKTRSNKGTTRRKSAVPMPNTANS